MTGLELQTDVGRIADQVRIVTKIESQFDQAETIERAASAALRRAGRWISSSWRGRFEGSCKNDFIYYVPE